MIFDRLEKARAYGLLGESFTRAFDWLARSGSGSLAVGRYDIDGSDVYALVQEYVSKAPELGMWEAHRQYVDLQYVVSGEESIGFVHLSRTIPGEYEAAKDFLPLQAAADFQIKLVPGDFVVLFPHDAHMPGMSFDPAKPSQVRKIVIKIRIAGIA